MHVILDVSRLLYCVLRPAPSGVDRVEMAYARRWATEGADATLVAQSPWGWFAALPRTQVQELVDVLGEVWSQGPDHGPGLRRARQIALALAGRMLAGIGRGELVRRIRANPRSVFLLVSHRALEQVAPIVALRRTGARFVPLIHDLIPTTHPEYSRPFQIERHARRIANTAELADGVIVNSATTADTLLPYLLGQSRVPPIAVAPLGVELRPPPAVTAPGGSRRRAPYFVVLGTIEPRKNHLLLLNLWRDLAARLGPEAPRLLIVGRRGWENENILDMLDRCAALRGLVREIPSPPDAEVSRLVAGARALLFPSFVEGYGLPLAEALALGVPAICSDLPALREVGGDVPEFLDPLDGPAWREAVLDYAQPVSARRGAQLRRLQRWEAPGWDAHFAEVDALLDQLVAAPDRVTWPRPADAVVAAGAGTA